MVGILIETIRISVMVYNFFKLLLPLSKEIVGYTHHAKYFIIKLNTWNSSVSVRFTNINKFHSTDTVSAFITSVTPNKRGVTRGVTHTPACILLVTALLSYIYLTRRWCCNFYRIKLGVMNHFRHSCVRKQFASTTLHLAISQQVISNSRKLFG